MFSGNDPRLSISDVYEYPDLSYLIIPLFDRQRMRNGEPIAMYFEIGRFAVWEKRAVSKLPFTSWDGEHTKRGRGGS